MNAARRHRIIRKLHPNWMNSALFAVATILSFLTAWTEGCAAEETSKLIDAAKPGQVKPEIFSVEPRGLQRGTTNRFKLTGTNLLGLTGLKLYDSKLRGQLLSAPEPATNEVWIELSASADLARGPYEFSVQSTNLESTKLKLQVDDLPQVSETATKNTPNQDSVLKLPMSYWGTLNPAGDADEIVFAASTGDELVFDLSARSIGSKANAMLTLLDDRGSILAANSGFDGGDPLLHFRIPSTGRYHVRISERTEAGSKGHFYRLSMGTLPLAVGHFPLGIRANQESEVRLIGFNLPPPSSVHLKASAAGELEIPLDPGVRSRRSFKVVVNENPELVETEPNDSTEKANPLFPGQAIDGRIDTAPGQPADVDTYQFEAHREQPLVIETDAARRGSPIDTKIEVLHADGRPVERLLLQAVRDSHITFRNIDSQAEDVRVENWREMELNQLIYLQGEVCKILRMPQGPDSGMQFYGVGGKRCNYFDTSPFAHAIDEPAYIVEPHPPGTALVPNGLPVFTVNYVNDDDADRALGSDSRLLFTPPTDGRYFVRVSDTRGHAGERFGYRLILRAAQPDFKVTLNSINPSVAAGAGAQFSVNATRIDGFDGDIRINITRLPPGFSSLSPLVIQAGHRDAKGTINAALDAVAPMEAEATNSQVTATGDIGGKPVIKEVNNFGKITLAAKPKLFVALEPYEEGVTNFVERSISDKPLEINIAPGQSIPVWLKIKRNGHEELVTFGVESLPHGVIVDNIGLNGVLIPKGQNSRQIFLTAAKWVPEVDRLCFVQARDAGSPTSLPVMLHVRKGVSRLSRTTP